MFIQERDIFSPNPSKEWAKNSLLPLYKTSAEFGSPYFLDNNPLNKQEYFSALKMPEMQNNPQNTLFSPETLSTCVKGAIAILVKEQIKKEMAEKAKKDEKQREEEERRERERENSEETKRKIAETNKTIKENDLLCTLEKSSTNYHNVPKVSPTLENLPKGTALQRKEALSVSPTQLGQNIENKIYAMSRMELLDMVNKAIGRVESENSLVAEKRDIAA